MIDFDGDLHRLDAFWLIIGFCVSY